MKRSLAILLRSLVVVSPIALTVLQFDDGALDFKLKMTLVFVFGVAATGGAVAGTTGKKISAWNFLKGLDHVDTTGHVQIAQKQAAVQAAKKSIKILDSYWGARDEFREPIRLAMERNAKLEVHILVAKPNGNFVRVRTQAMRKGILDSADLDRGVAGLSSLSAYLEKVPGLAQRLVVKEFDAIVPGPLLIVDDSLVFVGTFLPHDGSPQSPAMVFRTLRWGDSVAMRYVEAFDALWPTGC